MNKTQQYYRLRSGLTILPSHQKKIDELLANLVQKLPGRFVLLTDITGQVVSIRGDQNKINMVALGSLVAGDLAASQEIARLTGEYEESQMVLREGQRTHTFIAESGSVLALMVQVSNDVPLGWARMLIKQAAEQLPNILEEDLDKAEMALNEAQMAAETVVFEEDGLSEMFEDALDDLWLE